MLNIDLHYRLEDAANITTLLMFVVWVFSGLWERLKKNKRLLIPLDNLHHVHCGGTGR